VPSIVNSKGAEEDTVIPVIPSGHPGLVVPPETPPLEPPHVVQAPTLGPHEHVAPPTATVRI